MVAATFFAATPDLEGAVAAISAAPEDIQQNVSGFADAYMLKAWNEELRASPASRVQQLAIVEPSSARTFVVGTQHPGFMVKAADSASPLRGGLLPNVHGRAFEFGTNWRGSFRKPGFMQRSRAGRLYEVRNKRTQSPLPRRNNTGHVFYPAVERIGKRAAHLFAQTIFRALAEAVEGAPRGS